MGKDKGGRRPELVEPFAETPDRDEREVPHLRRQAADDVIAILVGDMHLSDRPPIARSGEEWYAAMKRPLDQLRALQAQHGGAIILYAGDITDHWRESPALVNFLLVHLPEGFAVPGNHDLLHGNYNSLDKTAYWTLVEAGRIKHLDPYIKIDAVPSQTFDSLRIVGMPWGFPLQALEQKDTKTTYIACVHRYIWSNASGKHIKAKPEEHWKEQRKKLKNFDVALFGDNHGGFIVESKTKGMPHIVNPGCLIRRKIDEINYKPFVGLLHRNGSVSRHYLDVSQDTFLDTRKVNELTGTDISKLIEEFERIGSEITSYADALMSFLSSNGVEKAVAKVIRSILEKEKQK